MQGLTDRQRQILDFITHRIQEQGYPPTIREIGEEMGIKSTNGVNDHLKALERKGYLMPVENNVHPIGPIGDMVSVPLLGRVAAGSPILAEENVQENLHIDSFFLGASRSQKVFALRVSGDSMIEAGIFDGDYIFVRKALEAKPHDIVVAMIDGEATVKTYLPKGDTVYLIPENSSMEPIRVRKSDFRSTSILGIVCGVYRKM
ncbi:unnamed protein product [Chondrus crispus]|uniref:LexA repressor n=1 Tax=Chondrus crispus TaxID=2769 RepID=R7Q5K7_CHOCR|nr:unnamed protein product [Chondrus crispus]CDF32750.1 unnamed protein product [Chondrus crispus]|eukprot:XP_005712521.1 unnamed protein product [Chondrus crispus]